MAKVLRKVLEVIEGYVLLAPSEMLSTYALDIFNGFSAQIVPDVNAEAVNIITSVVEMIIRTSSGLGQDAVNAVGKALVDSGLIVKVFEAIYGTWQAHQTTGPNKKYPEVESIILTDYFQILSRLVMCDTKVFLDIVGYIGSMNFVESGSDQTMKWLLEEWFTQVY